MLADKGRITLNKVVGDLDRRFGPLVTDEELPELERIGYSIQRSAGDPFFLEGERGDFALLIRKGHVKATRGKPSRIIDVRGPGAIVGEMAVISKNPRMASVIAWNDVEALYLPGHAWLHFLMDHPRAMLALMSMMAAMVERQAEKNIESELAIEQQLAKRLIELVDSGLGEPDDKGVVLRKVSQQDLASLIGAKKLDSVKKVIQRLKAASIVGTGRQLITIFDVARLREVADGKRPVS